MLRFAISTLSLFLLAQIGLQIVVVPTASMERTVMVGDHLLINRFPFGPTVLFPDIRLPRWGRICRGEIVSFHPPGNSADVYLKRVIAVGGDHVAIRNGSVYVNSVRLDESYLGSPGRGWDVNMDVARGEMFVLGDNRNASEDSRYFGTVPEANVIGKPVMVMWSFRFPARRWRRAPEASIYLDHPFAHLRWNRLLRLLQ